MDGRVAVDLAGGRLEDLGAGALGQAQHVDGAVDGCLGGLHRVELVVHRGGGAGEVVDLVRLHIQGKGHIMAHQLKAGVADERGDVMAPPGEEVVDAQNFAAVRQQPGTEVRADETGATGHDNAFQSFPLH